MATKNMSGKDAIKSLKYKIEQTIEKHNLLVCLTSKSDLGSTIVTRFKGVNSYEFGRI